MPDTRPWWLETDEHQVQAFVSVILTSTICYVMFSRGVVAMAVLCD